MKLSFCVPVYNRADRISVCLESLVDQTLPADDYEIIVVDDGSTDGSAEAATRFFEHRGFSHGYVHRLSENSGGASVPRNEAVRHARGNYLFFVDSDDHVSPDLAARVTSYATDNASDLVYVKYGVDGEGLIPPKAFSSHGNLPQADIVRDGLLYATMVHKAFLRSAWVRLGLAFDPGIRVYEDMLVTVKFLFGTKNHSVLADQEYYFFVNHGAGHLHDSTQPLETTFRLYAEVLDTILASSLGDETYRLTCAAVIINRIARHGPASVSPHLSDSLPAQDVREWLGLWHSLLASHFPVGADHFVAPPLLNTIRSLRRGNLTAVRISVRIEALHTTHPTLSRVLRRLFRYVTFIPKAQS